ncbi:MAG: Gp49 family protein [Rubrivivax sp.]|nr:Gp49 family protein [Rubrivivax sp.]MDP3610923.1 Gp49 family protein [Rubrivivax sp.]
MQRIESPRVDDAAIEAEIRERASVAARVTPEDVEAAIASEFYFTAADGVRGESQMGTSPAGLASSLERLTLCVLVLRNGFTVTGESACASAENFKADIGRKVARQNAVNKVWPLLGYALAIALHQLEQTK